MSFLSGILVTIGEWLLSKLLSFLGAMIKAFVAKKESDEALAKNKENLQTAIKSGDPNAITKAGENSLNNSRNP